MATVPELSWFKERVTALQENLTDRNKMFDEIDDMDSRTWEMPETMGKVPWVMKVTEAMFTQSLKACVRMLSGKSARFTVTPIHPAQQASQDLADRLEKALEWILDRAGRRRPATVLEDICYSAAKYAEVCAQVTFLPTQIKSVEKAKGQANRLRAMRRHSDFLIDVYDARDVFPRYSTGGLEEVALVTIEDPQHIIGLYGKKAAALDRFIKLWNADPQHSASKITQCLKRDYVSWDYRALWVSVDTENGATEDFEIVREDWKWPFLPWVCRVGGTSLESAEDRKRRPILYDAWRGDDWEVANRVITLRYSDMLRYALSPKRVYQSDTEGQPKVDETSPDLTTKVRTDESLTTLQQVPPDANMGILHQELRASNERSTLSSILLGGEVPAQAAFATVNLVTHSALAAMRPIQTLVQNAVADIGELCLLWVKYSGTETMAYDLDPENKSQAREYLISPDDIDADNLFVSCEVEADVPTDRQSRAVTAGALIDRGIITRRTAMQDIGIRNAGEEESGIYLEKLMDAYLMAGLDNIRFTSSMEAQQQMRQQLTQELMQQIAPLIQKLQAQAGGQPGGQPGGQNTPPGQPGNMPPQQPMPETGIPTEANPAEGGPVPAEFAPGATREMQTGQARGGADIV